MLKHQFRICQCATALFFSCQDSDGWTPLHAAAHWAQREACELLVEHNANMEIKNCVGQTCFDVADPDVLRWVLQVMRPSLKQFSGALGSELKCIGRNYGLTDDGPRIDTCMHPSIIEEVWDPRTERKKAGVR